MEFDVVVIGSGPAGHHAAIQSAKLGKSVAIVERRSILGGAGLHAGTIPSKTLREAVLYLTGYRLRGLYGESYCVSDKITLPDLRFRVDHVIAHEVEVYRSHFIRNGVTVLTGEASFVDSQSVRVVGADAPIDIRAQKIILATGSRPARPSNVPFDGKRVFDTDQLWTLQQSQIPQTLTIVGGGVIGIEYACCMAALGVVVTLIERRPRILDFVDEEVVDALCYQMRAMKTEILLGEDVEDIAINAERQVVTRLASGKTITSEALLYAVGRVGNSDRLNLAAAGLTADGRGRIAVDRNYRTSVANIYAVGDLIGFPALASTSMEQGRIAACSALGVEATSMRELFPYGIYTIPEISYVGLNEEELTRDGVPYEVGMAGYREIARGQILGDQVGFLKLLFHRESKRLLGVHILGEGASELVHIGQMVLALGGTINTFVDTVFNYPTLAECYKVAALSGLNQLSTSPQN